MTKEYCEEMITELVGHYNICNSHTKREEINTMIKKYKEKLKELQGLVKDVYGD